MISAWVSLIAKSPSPQIRLLNQGSCAASLSVLPYLFLVLSAQAKDLGERHAAYCALPNKKKIC